MIESLRKVLIFNLIFRKRTSREIDYIDHGFADQAGYLHIYYNNVSRYFIYCIC